MQVDSRLESSLTPPTMTPAPLPHTSLIICSRNRPRMLNDTVVSILNGNEVPTELVVIDQSGAPNIELKRLVTGRNCAIQYLWTHSKGLSIARNMGIAASRHAILAFTDDDVLVTPDWYGTLIRALVNAGERAVVTGLVRPTDPEKPGGFQLSIKTDDAAAVYEGRVGEDVLLPLNMALHRCAPDEVGDFDTRLGTGAHFPSSEDNDFGFRLLEAGYRIIYVPEAVLFHRAWRTARDYLPLSWSYGRGQGAYYAKYFGLRDRYMLKRALGEVFRYLRRIPARLRRRQLFVLLANTVFVVGVLAGAGEWLLTQRKTR